MAGGVLGVFLQLGFPQSRLQRNFEGLAIVVVTELPKPQWPWEHGHQALEGDLLRGEEAQVEVWPGFPFPVDPDHVALVLELVVLWLFVSWLVQHAFCQHAKTRAFSAVVIAVEHLSKEWWACCGAPLSSDSLGLDRCGYFFTKSILMLDGFVLWHPSLRQCARAAAR